MKFGRLIFGICVICCVLVLHGRFTAFAFGVEPNAPSGGKGQTPAQSPAPADANQGIPKIFFAKTTNDFGQVTPGSASNCEFKFQNKGTGILKISDIGKTCGCTVSTLDKKDYAPGEEGTVKVQYTADSGVGVRTRNLYVLSNDPNTPKLELTIIASIAQKVVCEPERLDYKLKGDKAGLAELTIRSVDEKPFAITRFSSTADAVTADFDPNKTAAKFVLQTKIDHQKMGNSNNGRIEITITHPDNPSFTIPFSVLPAFRVDPPAINILNAEPAKTVQRELWLLNNYGDDFDVNSVTSKEGIIKVVSQEKVGNRCRLNVEITPPPAKGTARMFTDTLSISTKDGAKIDVVLRGFYQR
ncbi:MAG: DUF1573 domain-containing protein [Sedimentisphaerales bacterium]|jgi:hypothetical protein